jgi:hypothetical protein
MKKTATVHNPTNFEPADYEVIDYLDNKRPEYYGQTVDAYAEDIKFWEEEMERALGAEWRSKIHRCIHCGNGSVRWITVTEHIPTGDRVVFGADCTSRLGFPDKHAFKLAQLKSKAELGHARLKVWKARTAFLAANPAFAAVIEQAKGEAHARNTFAQDVIGKLDRFGSISENQMNAVIASLARDIEFAAKRALEAETPKGDAPVGRVTVTGTVLSTKEVESDFGPTTKMLMQLDNNSRVWMTVPRSAEVERGMTLTVTATFTVSETDKSFAFGKRPTLKAAK